MTENKQTQNEKNAGAETHAFQAETQQLLHLMIHSLYSEKEIFLRELISNASDALDRFRFEALTNDKLESDAPLEIRLEADPKARTLTIYDSGIGMSRDEVIKHIGTIAKSGTRELIQKMQAAGGDLAPIGQFGVGFYVSFMVADKVELVTRRADSREAVKWESKGDGSYTLSEARKVDRGTAITLHLKPIDAEKGLEDFTQEWVLSELVKKYSDFVRYPIILKVQRDEPERDKDGKPVEGAKTITRYEERTLNSMKAIWKRKASDVSEDELNSFYSQVSHDWEKPLKSIFFNAEGRYEYSALMFIPSRANMDLYMRGQEYGLQLYVKNVKIMERAEELLPSYLRFIKGVVDASDLPLNVSREMLQNDGQVTHIRKALTKKVIDTLKTMLSDEDETYRGFWAQFGRVLKEGVAVDAEQRERLLEVTLFENNTQAKATTLKQYLERMKPDQDKIYYLSGESREVLERSPHLEAFNDKGYEVLFCTDPVDEFVFGAVNEFEGKKLQSAAKGAVELGSEDERKQAEEARKEKQKELEPWLNFMQRKLDKWVREVRVSSRLTNSPVCLVSDDNEQSAYVQRLLQQAGQAVPASKRIMEVNPRHALIEKLRARFEANPSDPQLDEAVNLLFGQALLSEGSELPDPGTFAKNVAELMVRSLAV